MDNRSDGCSPCARAPAHRLYYDGDAINDADVAATRPVAASVMVITQEPLYTRLLSKTLGSSHVAFICLSHDIRAIRVQVGTTQILRRFVVLILELRALAYCTVHESHYNKGKNCLTSHLFSRRDQCTPCLEHGATWPCRCSS